MSGGEVSLKGLMCQVPTSVSPLNTLPLSNDFLIGVCNLTLDAEKISVSVDPEWLAKFSERSEAQKKGGFFTRRASKVADSRVNWFKEKLGGRVSVPYSQIGKVVGKKWKSPGPSFKKLGNPVEYMVRFNFNEGDHFWSKSYVEFMLTAGEYATIVGCLRIKPGLAGRADFQEP